MGFISSDAFTKNCIYTTKQQKKKEKLWIRIKDLKEKLDLKNVCDLVDK